MITKITTIFIISILLFTGCGEKQEKQDSSKQSREVKDEQKITSNIIELKTLQDETLTLTAIKEGIIFENFKDKVVLLDFFATWCPPCKAEMPHLVSIQSSYKDQVQIIAVLMEEYKNNSELQSFKNEYHVNFPITNSPANFDLSDALGGIKSLPTMVMYDKHGEYFTHYVGAAPQEMIEADIKKALLK
jgi:thiol-disulfide isomerase/thioredoxin